MAVIRDQRAQITAVRAIRMQRGKRVGEVGKQGLLAHVAHWLAVLWLGLNIMDSLVSRYALHHKVAYEANPVYQDLGPVAADAIKGFATLAILFLIWCLWRRSQRVAVGILGLLCAWVAVINLWNLYWLS